MCVRMRLWAVVIGIVLAGCGVAEPRPFSYKAEPPTKGALYADGQTDRYLLGGTWLYRADPNDVGQSNGFWREDPSTDDWSPVAVPYAYNAGRAPLTRASMYGSVGWFRKDFTLPRGAFAASAPAGAQRWIIRFESVNYRATVWLNGHLIGHHAGAYLPFEFVLVGLRSGVNQLIVRVDDRREPWDLPSGPSGGWWNYGGILREVYLRAVDGADISQVQIRPLIRCPSCTATVAEQVVVRNLSSSPQSVQLQGQYGHARLDFGSATIAPGASWLAGADVTIASPRLWAPGDPYLYRATLTLSDSRGRALGGYLEFSGIRSIAVTHDGQLELNGRRLHLRGINLHEQNLLTGAALDPAQLSSIMTRVRQLGATVIRAHYPLNPELEEMADRDGILVWSEIPVWGVGSRWLQRPAWVARAHAMLADDILANQNHASVLLWSIGNELPIPATPAEASYIAGATALAHQLDPTRPVAIASTEWPLVGCQQAYAPVQVIGLNDYFGWFHTARTPISELGPFLDSLRSCYPHQALIVTEFGFDASRHGPATQRGTYEFQSAAAAYHLQVFAARPWLSGAIYFLLQDFAARPGWGGGEPHPDPPFVQKGLIDRHGRLKPAFGTIASVYRATIQIAPAPAPTRRGRRTR